MSTEKKIVRNALYHALDVAKKHKLYFTLLFFTQAFFLIAVLAIFFYFSVNIGENLQSLTGPLTDIPNTITQAATADFVEHFDYINNAYSDLKTNAFILVLLLLFTLMNYYL